MSLIPQIAKLTAIAPSTTAITIRPSQLLEALRIPRSIKVLGWMRAVGPDKGTPSRARIIVMRAPRRNNRPLWRHHRDFANRLAGFRNRGHHVAGAPSAGGG